MAKSSPLYEQIQRPNYRLTSPDKILSEGEFDLLGITVEDFRYAVREVTDDLHEVAADIRSRSTILRRLLCHGDLFNLARIVPPPMPLRVNARMLDFSPLHPGVIISCGAYPWADDRLEGMAVEFSIKGIPPLTDAPWSYRENADVALSEYLDGLALGVLGTRIKRRDLVKYVADKKAAHVSDRRKKSHEDAIDRVWSQLTITIKSTEGDQVKLNAAYLEILSVIEALAQSASINSYIDHIAEWLSTAAPHFSEDVRPIGLSLPMEAKKSRK